VGLGLMCAGAVVGLLGQIVAQQPAYADTRWREPVNPEGWLAAAWWMTTSTWGMMLLALAGFLSLGVGATAYSIRSWRADAVRRLQEEPGPVVPKE
jgi:hypothetical protein